MEQSLLIFDSSISDPSNIISEDLIATVVTNSDGIALLENIPYGDYKIEVKETSNSQKFEDTFTIDSDNIQVAVTPTYTITAVAVAGALIQFTDSSNLVTNIEATNGTAVINKVPAGDYSITITHPDYETLETTGTIQSTTDTNVILEFTMSKIPKLVQITTNQTNYQLDTSYTYVSMLVVGKGGATTDATGGGSGMIVYKKNMEITPETLSAINVTFDNETVVYLLSNIEIESNTYLLAGNANSRSGASTVQYWLNGELSTDLLDGYGSSGGGYIVNNSTVKNAGSGGGGSAGPGYNVGTGGKSGDGPYGFTGGTSKGVTIPVKSIFQGSGQGGSGYYVDNSNAGGAGGYGNGNNYNSTSKPSYGAGANGGNKNISDGIVCLYYHVKPL